MIEFFKKYGWLTVQVAGHFFKNLVLFWIVASAVVFMLQLINTTFAVAIGIILLLLLMSIYDTYINHQKKEQ